LPAVQIGKYTKVRNSAIEPVVKNCCASVPGMRISFSPEREAAAPPPAGLVLLTVQGHSVEGLDGDGLIAVLRALA